MPFADSGHARTATLRRLVPASNFGKASGKPAYLAL